MGDLEQPVHLHIGNTTHVTIIAADANCEAAPIGGLTSLGPPMSFCPICRREAAVVSDDTGDADHFDCLRHGKFRVAATVFAISRGKRATTEQWEAALEKAKARQPSAAAPVILSYDF